MLKLLYFYLLYTGKIKFFNLYKKRNKNVHIIYLRSALNEQINAMQHYMLAKNSDLTLKHTYKVKFNINHVRSYHDGSSVTTDC